MLKLQIIFFYYMAQFVTSGYFGNSVQARLIYLMETLCKSDFELVGTRVWAIWNDRNAVRVHK